MKLDQTKILTLTLATLALSKLVYEFVTTGKIDLSSIENIQQVVGEAIVIVIAIITAIKHHEEVELALYTPVPKNETEQ